MANVLYQNQVIPWYLTLFHTGGPFPSHFPHIKASCYAFILAFVIVSMQTLQTHMDLIA